MNPLLITLLTAFCLTANAGHESKGGDGFEIGGAVKLFDTLEHDQPFTPSDLPEYKKFIEPQFIILRSKLPRTAQYIQGFLTRGIRPRWYFVKYSLREVKDESQSSLVLTYNKVQVASNDGVAVQIEKSLRDKMEEIERAWLLTHEAFWSAADLSGDARSVRNLTSLLFHDKLKIFTAEDIAAEIRRSIPAEGPKGSKLRQALRLDLGEEVLKVPEELRDLEKRWKNLSLMSDGVTPSECVDETDQCVFLDQATSLYWSAKSPTGDGILDFSDAEEGCRSLKSWGGYSDWSLPSFNEMLSSKTAKGDSSSGKMLIFDVTKLVPRFGLFNAFYWTATAHETKEQTHFAFNLQANQHRAVEDAALLSWRCVRSNLSAWQDVSRKSDGETLTVCKEKSDECAFLDKKNDMIWMEQSKATRTRDMTSADACPKRWAGMDGGWKTPSGKEVRDALDAGLGRLALRYDAFAPEPFGTFTYRGEGRGAGLYSEVFGRDSIYWGHYLSDTSWHCVRPLHYQPPADPKPKIGTIVDSDGDGVLDHEDICPRTRKGSVIHREGQFKGCAQGQQPGTGLYPEERQ